MPVPHYVIKVRHPIASNPRTADGADVWSEPFAWDGNPADVHEVVALITRRVGFTAHAPHPTTTRWDPESERVLVFPRRYTTGVHCAWLERV